MKVGWVLGSEKLGWYQAPSEGGPTCLPDGVARPTGWWAGLVKMGRAGKWERARSQSEERVVSGMASQLQPTF